MAPTQLSQPGQTPTQPKRDWIAILVTALPGLAALIAVAFTYVSVKATENQVQIARQGQNTAEQGQITDRYNAAITNLGSRSIDIRLGGIYALQRLMQDSPRDQPTIVAVLCAFVRDQSASPTKPLTLHHRQPTDIQAALTVVGTRDTKHDTHTTVVDFDHAQLAGARLQFLHLSRADFTNAKLTNAYLLGANLSQADLINANLIGADLTRADLTRARLTLANLTNAYLFGANLHRAYLGGANLSRANLTGADLIYADLIYADLTNANLTGANLTGAYLRGADLTGANLTGANLTGANLTNARWPAQAAVPKGWLRNTHSGRVTRAS